ncbi:IspD/TarI family cytidylyltransferase [Olsenella sp. YH-ols2217]|uniref:IspD/TarI family cytidylyltransferase n=1 Tax=Kribbibacterium absianum TaxID=3044210 RepID=A0ABT6ZNS5_9ACTN|nr:MULTISPECIES: IspD/TarI family cytidylyltransferase [unclassified Olsenella]MDJ1122160.1 IspD/TarI family cytidylyltransferase [Olsenella sp. YH-ols2216]MDJ1130168.1 IspD/TarI family cytidylyltransferase [Olsenella sp. YH-ols2217]
MAYRTLVVIFAGGTGSRMQGAKIPKQFLMSGGKPIIAHTISKFQEAPGVDGIVVVSIESGIPYLREVVEQNGFSKVLSIVPGGETGQDSIFRGLDEIHRLGIADEDTVVLIHDGVRPLIDAPTIEACARSVRERGCTATVAPVVETVIEEQDGKVVDVLDRSRCKLARAPQGFTFCELYQAHLTARANGLHDFIDSVSMMAHFGYQIFTVDGPVDNIKITTRRDYFSFKGFTDYNELSQFWSEG